MSQALLVQIILCLCKGEPSHADKIICTEKYVNCAIVKDGQILKVKEFDEKCNFQPKQAERCYSN